MTIVRYEPWAFVSRVQRHLDRALGETQNLADGAAAVVSWIPHVDIREEAGASWWRPMYDVEPKDIEITADKGVLTVKGRAQLAEERDHGRLRARGARQQYSPAFHPS